jgi:hypothetical protein
MLIKCKKNCIWLNIRLALPFVKKIYRMKKSKTKGDVQKKISSKIQEAIKELKVEKGSSTKKVISKSAKKIAKTITKKSKKGA